MDTGSEVSTITEDHFNLHFRPKGTELLSTAGWLTLTAANGLEIPYVGYFELDVEALDNTLRHMGILVVKNPPDEISKQRKQKVPGLLGMNIIGKLGEDLSEENGRNYLQGVEPIWAQALQAGKRMNSSTRGLIRVAGRTPVRVPAGSVATVQATGWRGQNNEEHPMAIAEPLAGYHQPGRIILVNTLVRPSQGHFHVRVANPTEKDVWLLPRTPVGVLHNVAGIQETKDNINFKRVSINEERVELGQTTKACEEENPCPVDLSGVDCTEEQRQLLESLLKNHAHAFATSSDDLGYTDAVHHKIRTADDIPVTQPHRRVPPTQYQEVKDHIHKLLDNGIIRESHSPYASPVVLVRKKDGSLRLCVDYRKLNAKTVKDAFPLPRIDESLDALRGACWFSTIDLASGFNQVAVDELDKEKTAFSTPFGLFEYNRMPFGLCNAPATFQRLMQSCLHDQIFQLLLVYMDDIIVFSSSFEAHLERLDKVLTRLEEHGLKIKPSKCQFLRKQVTYLGYRISATGVSTDPDKVTAVKNWEVPNTVKELRSFLGFASYYRRFVKDFSKVAGPLHDLVNRCLHEFKTKKHLTVPFSEQWDSGCQEAFNELKQRLTTARYSQLFKKRLVSGVLSHNFSVSSTSDTSEKTSLFADTHTP